jgi:hypothetical protein
MTSKQYAVVSSVLRTKFAADEKSKTLGELAGSAKRGVGHVWDAANAGAQAAAKHLEAKGAPKIVSGAIHAAPAVGAVYGGYKALKGLSNWNTNRVIRNQGGY